MVDIICSTANIFKQKGVARLKNDQDMLLPFNYLHPPFLLTPPSPPPIPSPFFMLALLSWLPVPEWGTGHVV